MIPLTEFECKLQNKFVENWKQEIATKPKLRTYRIFKNTFETEKYVNFLHKKCLRSLTAQFRVGILPLAIETGRFKRVILEERFCYSCPQSVEDEMHFLLECPTYTDQRQCLFEKALELDPTFNTFQNSQKMLFLLTNLFKDVSFYLSNSWQIRQSQLYH